MPTYTFICQENEKCGTTFDIKCSFSEYEKHIENLPKCPLCSADTKRYYGNLNIGIQFIGSGFYTNDVKKLDQIVQESNTPRKHHSDLHWQATEAYEKKILNKENFGG